MKGGYLLERGALIADQVVPCCMGFAAAGPEHCTCWEPVLEPMPHGERQAGPPVQRRTCCHDCAYRNGSPEREEGGDHERDLLAIAVTAVFVCHVGLVKLDHWRHPSGAVFPAQSDHYVSFTDGDRAWKADGSPAELCAGWAAYRHALGVSG